MADTTVQVIAPSGLSLTVELYALGSDVLANGSGDNLTEETNRKGLYAATVAEALSGIYSAHVKLGSAVIAVGWLELADDTGTYVVEDSLALLQLDMGAGTGARTITITVDDGTDPLEGALIRMKQGAEDYVVTTDANGVAVVGRDDASWQVTITKPGYDFVPTTLVVSGDASVTYSMTPRTITPSAEPGQTTGFARIYGKTGAVEKDVTVQVQLLSANPGTDGISYDAEVVSKISDVSGDVEFTGLWRGGLYRARRSKGPWVEFTADDAATTPLPPTIGREVG